MKQLGVERRSDNVPTTVKVSAVCLCDEIYQGVLPRQSSSIHSPEIAGGYISLAESEFSCAEDNEPQGGLHVWRNSGRQRNVFDE